MFEESVTEITDIEVLYNYLHGGRAIVKLEAPSGTSHNYVFQKPANPSEFPDDYIFTGPQNAWYAQIGNAVPVKLAYVIGRAIKKFL